jgi:hypothetical protein
MFPSFPFSLKGHHQKNVKTLFPTLGPRLSWRGNFAQKRENGERELGAEKYTWEIILGKMFSQ